MASELEESLGGTYTVLSQEFQLPYIRLKIMKMREAGAFPEDSDSIEPMITTGLEGLGRGQDYNKILTFIQTVKGIGEQAASMINFEFVLKSLATSVGLKAEEVLLDEQTVAARAEQAQMSEMMGKVAAPVAGQLAGGVAQSMQEQI